MSTVRKFILSVPDDDNPQKIQLNLEAVVRRMLKDMGIKPKSKLGDNPKAQDDLLKIGGYIQSIIEGAPPNSPAGTAVVLLLDMISEAREEMQRGQRPKRRSVITTTQMAEFLMSPIIITQLMQDDDIRRLFFEIAATEGDTPEKTRKLEAEVRAKLDRWAGVSRIIRSARAEQKIEQAEPIGQSPSSAIKEPVKLRVEAEEAQDAQEQVQQEEDYSEVANALVRQVLVDNVNQVAERERQLEEAAERQRILQREEDEAKLAGARRQEALEQQALARSYQQPTSGAAGLPYVTNIEQVDPPGPDVMTRDRTVEQKEAIPLYLQEAPSFVPVLPDNIAVSYIEPVAGASQIRQRRPVVLSEVMANVELGAPPDVAFRMTRGTDVDQRVRDGDRKLAEGPESKAQVNIAEASRRLNRMQRAVTDPRNVRSFDRVLEDPSTSIARTTIQSQIREAMSRAGLSELTQSAQQTADEMLATMYRTQPTTVTAEQGWELSPNVRDYQWAIPALVMAGMLGAPQAAVLMKGLGMDAVALPALAGLVGLAQMFKGQEDPTEVPGGEKKQPERKRPEDPEPGRYEDLPQEIRDAVEQARPWNDLGPRMRGVVRDAVGRIPGLAGMPAGARRGIIGRLVGMADIIPEGTFDAMVQRGLGPGAFLAGVAAISFELTGREGRAAERFQRLMRDILADRGNFSSERAVAAVRARIDSFLRDNNVSPELSGPLLDRMQKIAVDRMDASTTKVQGITQQILGRKRIELSDEERREIAQQVAGRGDLKEIQDIDNEDVVGDLRPSFRVLGTDEDKETPEQSLAERLQFASFAHVKPGFGNGPTNPLYLRNVRWDRDVRGIAPGADPTLTMKPNQRVDYEPFYHYAPLTTMYRGHTTATHVAGSGGRWMSNLEIQNLYDRPVAIRGVDHTQLVRGPEFRAQEVYDMNTGRNLTGQFSGAPMNVINSMPAKITDRLHPATGQNNYNDRGRVEPLCLERNPTRRKNTWYYANSTINPMEATDFKNRYDRAARPSKSFPTFMFQTGAIRASASMLPF